MTSGDAGLRVGHAERQRAIELVKAAYADGRLDQDELEQRAERALIARTAADLHALLADLGAASASPAAPPPWNPSLPARRPAHRAAGQLARVMRCVFCCGK